MEKIDKEYICNELISYIQNNLLDSGISITAETIFNQIGLDSMSIIEVVLFIERKFGVAIPEEDLIPENFKSIRSLSECAHKYILIHE